MSTARKTSSASKKTAKKTSKAASKKTAKKTSKAASKKTAKKTSKTANRKSPVQEWTLARIRDEWIDYFTQSEGHQQLPSAALIPAGDPTLLFTSAGMVQFKPYFAGTETPPSRRVITIQKCLRTTDLENVGKTDRHLTYFEMLGNFSFGDYFKEGAIRMAWEFSLKRLQLHPARIHATVYLEDDAAERLWHTGIGVPKERITRLGKEDNWWGPAGDSGACGPCSELYLDRGAEYCTHPEKEKASCKPGDECERYMEYWNLVFNEFHQDTSGKLHPLPQKGIDTGAGLERMAALLNKQESVFDTDEMSRLIAAIEKLTGELRADGQAVRYAPENRAPFRVLTDHLRAASFSIADGIMPDNAGRGYVIRRIIRRAAMFARELGVKQPILWRLVDELAEIYGDYYPEIRSQKDAVKKRLRSEEERFLHTLEQGLAKWEEFLSEHRKKKAKVFPGDDAFMLYDTFGFPYEMTEELAEKAGMQLDGAGFRKRMEEQQKRSAEGAKWKNFTLPPDLPKEIVQSQTEFTGYDEYESTGKILALIRQGADGAPQSGAEELAEGQAGIVALNRTPFYPEGGGQQGDTGRITTSDGAVFEVEDTQKSGGLYLHIGRVKSGKVKAGADAEARIDSERREGLTRHHSATHLLNDALRKVLGDHIVQTGSLVAPDYLRFDFSHPEKVRLEQLEEVERRVNAAIAEADKVESEVLPIDQAKQKGALATFGEKYGEVVRVVSMGEGGVHSIEFCGGCHVRNTGDVGFFHITRETSPGAGNRRIEALAGDRVRAYFQEQLEEVQTRLREHNERVQRILQDDPASNAGESLYARAELPDSAFVDDPRKILDLHQRIEAARGVLQESEKRLQKLEKERKSQEAGQLLDQVDAYLERAEEAGGIRIIQAVFAEDGPEPDALRKFGDRLREKSRGVVVLLGSKGAKSPTLLFMADKAAVEAGANMSDIVRAAAKLIGGGGGGRPDMAQAGGKDASQLGAAVAKGADLVRTALG